MELKVPYQNITDKKQAFELAKKHIPEVISKFNVSADIKSDEASYSLIAKGSGFEAKITFTDTEAILGLDLGFMLKPFKGKIAETIEKQIKKIV